MRIFIHLLPIMFNMRKKKEIQQQTSIAGIKTKQAHGWSLIETCEVIIMSLCILLLLFGAATFVYREWIKTPVPQVIELRISYSDSIPNSNVVLREDIDSLVSSVNTIMSSISSHYKTVDKCREEDNRLKSLGTLLFGIISSIALFFGYKSFKDIKDKGAQTASEVADNTAREVATSVATKTSQDYFDKTMPAIVKKQIDEKFSGAGKGALIQSIKDQILSILSNDIKREVTSQILENKEESEELEHPQELTIDVDAQDMFEAQPQIEEQKNAK